MPLRPTETKIFRDSATGYFGFRVRFQDSDRFHHTLATLLDIPRRTEHVRSKTRRT